MGGKSRKTGGVSAKLIARLKSGNVNSKVKNNNEQTSNVPIKKVSKSCARKKYNS